MMDRNIRETNGTNCVVSVNLQGVDGLVDMGLNDYMEILGFTDDANAKVGIVWSMNDEEIDVEHIYDLESGDILVNFNDDNYTEQHEDLLTSILMWADLEGSDWSWA